MRAFVLILALALPMPALAQEDPAPDDGPSLMERGARLFFRGLIEEMDPAMRAFGDFVQEAGPEMERFMQEMGPALKDLLAKVDDIRNYHGPEMLPNGDIILRRKTPEEIEKPVPGPAPGPGEEIEL